MAEGIDLLLNFIGYLVVILVLPSFSLFLFSGVVISFSSIIIVSLYDFSS